MPHLSPMNWLIAPSLFLLLSLPLLVSYLWWTQLPVFPMLKSTSKNSLNTWNWS